jgi:hypothetical protein
MAKELQQTILLSTDWDKSLSPENMQEALFRRLNLNPNEVWAESARYIIELDYFDREAYLAVMVDAAQGITRLNNPNRNLEKLRGLTNQMVHDAGADIPLYKGLHKNDPFNFLRGLKQQSISGNGLEGITVKIAVNTTGNKAMVLGSKAYTPEIVDYVFGAEFVENNDGIICGYKNAIGAQDKASILHSLSKGAIDNPDLSVNDTVPEEERVIPFFNIIHMGDSGAFGTDHAAWAALEHYAVNSHSDRLPGRIALYDPDDEESKAKARKYYEEGRVQYFTPADFSRDSKTSDLINEMIYEMAIHAKRRNEYRFE